MKLVSQSMEIGAPPEQTAAAESNGKRRFTKCRSMLRQKKMRSLRLCTKAIDEFPSSSTSDIRLSERRRGSIFERKKRK